MNHPPLRKAAPLQPGATIALVAPSGVSPAAEIDRAIAHLEEKGYRVAPGTNLYRAHYYLAGTDAERSADLMQALTDPDIAAVFCARGGYGCTRLLDQLDYQRIQDKILLGFSDTTGLHLALYARLGLVGFTGALAAFDLGRRRRDDFTEGALWRALTDPSPLGPLPLDQASSAVLRHGRAQGPLVGGNLALLCSLLGTPYMPPLKGALLFLEDVGEAPYRLDRMLNHLRLAGVFAQISGLVLGQFSDCFTAETAAHSPSLKEIVLEVLGDREIPVLCGLPHGHLRRRLVLPIGIGAALDTSIPALSLTEAALSA